MGSITIMAEAVECSQVAVVPTLVRTRPNEWVIRDCQSGRPLLFAPAADRRGFDRAVGEWLLLPHHMADSGECVHASKADLHAVLRDRYDRQVGERLHPGIHILECYNGQGEVFWLTDDPQAVEAVRSRIGELEGFERRLRGFFRSTCAKPHVKDTAVDGSRRMMGAVFGDVSRLPGRWRILNATEDGLVNALADDDEARAVLDALAPPGPSHIPGLDAKSTIFPKESFTFVHNRIGLLDDRRAVAFTGDYETRGTGAPARGSWHRVSQGFGFDVLWDLCSCRI